MSAVHTHVQGSVQVPRNCKPHHSLEWAQAMLQDHWQSDIGRA